MNKYTVKVCWQEYQTDTFFVEADDPHAARIVAVDRAVHVYEDGDQFGVCEEQDAVQEGWGEL